MPHEQVIFDLPLIYSTHTASISQYSRQTAPKIFPHCQPCHAILRGMQGTTAQHMRDPVLSASRAYASIHGAHERQTHHSADSPSLQYAPYAPFPRVMHGPTLCVLSDYVLVLWVASACIQNGLVAWKMIPVLPLHRKLQIGR